MPLYDSHISEHRDPSVVKHVFSTMLYNWLLLLFVLCLVIASPMAMAMAQAPHAPTGFAATASSQQVKLVWVAPAGTPVATGYNLKRSTNFQGPYTVIASPIATSYTDVAGLIVSVKSFL